MQKWLQDGRSFCIATVIKTWRSAPRQAGSAMLINDQGEILGSVSGGCIEGAVVTKSLELLQSNKTELLSFGVSNEEAWQVGLSCGGGITVLVRPFDLKRTCDQKIWDQLLRSAEAEQGISWVFPLDPAELSGWIGDDKDYWMPNSWPISVQEKLWSAHHNRTSTVVQDGSTSYFLQHMPSPEKLIIVGAAHISLPLVQMTTLLGFAPIIIDPRGLFVESLQKYCSLEDIHRAWPADILPDLKIDGTSYAVMLTHDPKIDDQALAILLKSSAKYIGALGSRKTHAKRVLRLQEAGFTQEEITRIHAPIGMDIGALTPEEIALSVCAELVAVRRQKPT